MNRLQGLGFSSLGVGFRVYGLGFRIQGFRAYKGSGFRVRFFLFALNSETRNLSLPPRRVIREATAIKHGMKGSEKRPHRSNAPILGLGFRVRV